MDAVTHARTGQRTGARLRPRFARARRARGRPRARQQPPSTCPTSSAASGHGRRRGDRRPAAARARQGARHAAGRNDRRRVPQARGGQGGSAGWRELSFDDRAAILLKAAELLSGPWRARLNAATMLGQSKTAYQAEIDSACELIDFWRLNVHFARQILEQQPPLNAKGVWNRSDYRSLEGFVYAITPFNFTAIAGNLPTAPALMGNTVVWKPADPAARRVASPCELLEEAGMPPGSSTW